MKLTVVTPAAVEAAAISVTLWAVPGVRVKEVGLAVTPVGNPVKATATEPVKPFDGCQSDPIGS